VVTMPKITVTANLETSVRALLKESAKKEAQTFPDYQESFYRQYDNLVRIFERI
jgi:hypothetical protein